MYNDIFNRIEEKYFLNKEQRDNLLLEIKNHITKDKFYESNILNIYFDNDNNDLVINSNSKPLYKDKIRLRSYEVPTLDSDVFLEIKSKYEGVTNKRRIKLKLREFYDYISGKVINNSQIMKEIDYLFNYYNLKPNYFVAYNRLSFKGVDDDNLRITLDSNLRSRKDNLRLEYGDKGEQYFKGDNYIMEIKTLNSMPLWLTSVLSKLKIYPTSFSKYGEIYKRKECSVC